MLVHHEIHISEKLCTPKVQTIIIGNVIAVMKLEPLFMYPEYTAFEIVPIFDVSSSKVEVIMNLPIHTIDYIQLTIYS